MGGEQKRGSIGQNWGSSVSPLVLLTVAQLLPASKGDLPFISKNGDAAMKRACFSSRRALSLHSGEAAGVVCKLQCSPSRVRRMHAVPSLSPLLSELLLLFSDISLDLKH